MLKRLGTLALLFYTGIAVAALDANLASAEDLQTIKGIGPVLSEKIVMEREQGRFSNWDDLIKRVRGVGAKSALRLSDGGLTVNGKAYEAKPQAPVAAQPGLASRRRP